MLITRAGINERIERFSRLTKEIEACENLTLETSAVQLSKSEQYDTYQALNGPLYNALVERL